MTTLLDVDLGEVNERRDALAPRPLLRRAPTTSPTFVTKFQTGHGWTLLNSGTLTDSTERPLFGGQSAKLVTSAANSDIHKSGLSLDLTDKVVMVWLRTDDDFGDILRLDISSDAYVNLRSIAASKYDYKPEYGWACVRFPVAVGTDTGTPNLASISRMKVRIGASGGTHTVYVGAVAYESQQTEYPNGVVTLTFDDSMAAHFALARRHMDTYGFPGVAYVIGEESEEADNLGMSVENLLQLEHHNGWEIGGHADREADHIDLTTLSEAQADDALGRMKQWMVREGFEGEHFAYPFSGQNLAVRNLARRYFKSARAVVGDTPTRYAPPVTTTHHRIESPMWGSSALTTVARMKQLIDAAKAAKLWLPLCFHDISNAGGSAITEAEFVEILAYIDAQDVAVTTLSPMFEAMA